MLLKDRIASHDVVGVDKPQPVREHHSERESEEDDDGSGLEGVAAVEQTEHG